MLRLSHLLNSVEEMNLPQPIALPIKSIRESEGLASFKPDPFCHCSGTKHMPLFAGLYTLQVDYFFATSDNYCMTKDSRKPAEHRLIFLLPK